MFSFFKKKKDHPQAPSWASAMNPEEYAAFLEAIDKYFTRHKITFEMLDGCLKTSPNDLGFSTVGLSNLFQICKQDRTNRYTMIVANHFDAMVRAHKASAAFEKLSEDYAQVKQYLGVRLYPQGYLAHIGKEHVMGRDFGGDIYAMLVYDLPDTVQNVNPAKAAKWGKSFEELFATGIQNIRQKYPFPLKQMDLDGPKIWFVGGDHFFVPNIAFDLRQHPQLLGTHGCLIGMPHRHAALIYPVNSTEVILALNKMTVIVHGMEQEGPGSLSSDIFWYRDGHFENVPYALEEGKLKLYPPNSFVEMLNMLAE